MHLFFQRLSSFCHLRLISIVALLIAPMTAFADASLQDVVNAINSGASTITNTITQLYTQTTQNITSSFNQPTTDQGIVQASGQISTTAQQQVLSNSQVSTQEAINDILGADDTFQANQMQIFGGNSGTTSIYNAATGATTDMVGAGMSQPGTWGIFTQSSPTTYQNNNFNVGALMEPLAYATPTQQQAAYNAIQYVNTLSSPYSFLDSQTIQQLQQAMSQSGYGNAAFQSYLVQMRGYATALSLGISNLYNFYNERVIQSNLAGQTTGASPTADQKAFFPNWPDASSAQITAFRDTRRSNDPLWYSAVQSETPAAVQLEILHVLADIQRELYQLHVDNENAIATLSMMSLSLVQQQQPFLSQSKQGLQQSLQTSNSQQSQTNQQQLQQQINSQNNSLPSTSATGSSTSGN